MWTGYYLAFWLQCFSINLSESWLLHSALGALASASLLLRAFQLHLYILPLSCSSATFHVNCCRSIFQSLCGTIFPLLSCCFSHCGYSHDITPANTRLLQQTGMGSNCLWCEIHPSSFPFFLLLACSFLFILGSLITHMHKLKNQPAHAAPTLIKVHSN